jgi:hypothetical protein
MTVGRVAGFLILMGVIGGGVVWLRSEEVRSAVRVQDLHHQEIALRRAIWRNQLEIGRLKSPAVVGQRVEPMELTVVPPHRDTEEEAKEAWMRKRVAKGRRD